MDGLEFIAPSKACVFKAGANPLQQLQTQIPRYQLLRDNRLVSPSRFGMYD